jgi:hypothetical protein
MNIPICHAKKKFHPFEYLIFWICTNIFHINHNMEFIWLLYKPMKTKSHIICTNLWNLVSLWWCIKFCFLFQKLLFISITFIVFSKVLNVHLFYWVNVGTTWFLLICLLYCNYRWFIFLIFYWLFLQSTSSSMKYIWHHGSLLFHDLSLQQVGGGGGISFNLLRAPQDFKKCVKFRKCKNAWLSKGSLKEIIA